MFVQMVLPLCTIIHFDSDSCDQRNTSGGANFSSHTSTVRGRLAVGKQTLKSINHIAHVSLKTKTYFKLDEEKVDVVLCKTICQHLSS